MKDKNYVRNRAIEIGKLLGLHMPPKLPAPPNKDKTLTEAQSAEIALSWIEYFQEMSEDYVNLDEKTAREYYDSLKQFLNCYVSEGNNV